MISSDLAKYSATRSILVASVPETIQKAPLAKVQTTCRKQKMCSVEGGYLSHYQNSMKNCFPVQNLTEIRQSNYGQKQFLKYRLSTIWNF